MKTYTAGKGLILLLKQIAPNNMPKPLIHAVSTS